MELHKLTIHELSRLLRRGEVSAVEVTSSIYERIKRLEPDVAAYVSQLPMTPHNAVGPGRDLDYGAELYKKECAECHGANGEGDGNEHIPLIQGQHYDYLVRQFRWIQMGKRRNADPKMVKQIKRFTTRDIHVVMDYVSRLRPPQEKIAKAGWRNPDFPSFDRHSMPSLMRHLPEPPMPPERPAN